MAIKSRKSVRSKSHMTGGFHISNRPVIRPTEEAKREGDDFSDMVELPRPFGAPILFAIARDPQTIFTYWSIDWPTIFAEAMPVDRQVHLRVYTIDGAQETSAAVEPMAGNSYLPVSQSRAAEAPPDLLRSAALTGLDPWKKPGPKSNPRSPATFFPIVAICSDKSFARATRQGCRRI